MALELPCLNVEPFDGGKLLVVSELRFLDGRLEYPKSFVINTDRHGERLAILAAERQ